MADGTDGGWRRFIRTVGGIVAAAAVAPLVGGATYAAVATAFAGLALLAVGEVGGARGWHLPGMARPPTDPPEAPYQDKGDFAAARRAFDAADHHGTLLRSREASADQVLAWQRATLHLVVDVMGNPVKEELRADGAFRAHPDPIDVFLDRLHAIEDRLLTADGYHHDVGRPRRVRLDRTDFLYPRSGAAEIERVTATFEERSAQWA